VSKMLMENKMFNQPTGGPMRRERPGRDLEAMEKKNQLPYVQMLAMRRKYPDPAPSATDSSMSDVAPKGRKAAVPAEDEMAVEAERRRSKRIADAGLAKQQREETAAEKAAWDAEVKKQAAEGRKYKKALAIRVRKLHVGASVQELLDLVDILARAGEKSASVEVMAMADENAQEQEEAEENDKILVIGLTEFIEEGIKLGEGLRYEGDKKSNAVLLASSLLEEMGAPVPEDPHFKDLNYGGRRRKTKKNKKSRRKTKRGSGEKPPVDENGNQIYDPNGNLVNPNPPKPPKKGGRRKTKRSPRTTRR
jgi:hypothetical protein